MKALIIGGGIGGLTTALTLNREGSSESFSIDFSQNPQGVTATFALRGSSSDTKRAACG